ncbi:hypothetical protein S101395_04492 [Bacillus sonorensis]|uniref:Uncharacterized protein n=1 Tax=Bacillus sonorensis TaxID=119858 RepID=A0ABM6LNI2_9BACI|nr:hypothetical protein S101395_04492 [Bacillus sonorensis]
MEMGLLNRLIEQAKNPKGFIGSIMLRIMNTAHTGMNKWALDKLRIREDSKFWTSVLEGAKQYMHCT